MPHLYNPTDSRLACYRLGVLLAPGERVEITDEDADALRDGTVFVVEEDTKAEKKAADKAEKAADEDADEKPKRAAASRETVKRGSKVAEVTTAPKPETRG